MRVLDNYRISYAQNREDVIIEAFFPDVEDGFYIDVGANHPVDDSVTKIFYDKGWRGINIEPSPSLHKKLVSTRSRDVNELVGIATKSGKLKFREYQNHGLSTFSDEMKQQYEHQPEQKTSTYTDYEVAVSPLKDVLAKTNPLHIHFMKVDVEGFEYEVLYSNDWKSFRPELICIEANHIVKDWHPILKTADYKMVFNDGLNEYFLAAESAHRLDLFDYAKSIVLSKPIINPGVAGTLGTYENMQTRVLTMEQELSQIQNELIQVISQRNSLFSQLQQYSHIRSQVRMLLVNFRAAYRSRLDRLNKPARLKRSIHFKRVVSKKSSREKLAQYAEEYDKSSLRETRIINGRIRRVVFKMLDALDRLAIRLVKFCLRVVRKILREIKYVLRNIR